MKIRLRPQTPTKDPSGTLYHLHPPCSNFPQIYLYILQYLHFQKKTNPNVNTKTTVTIAMYHAAAYTSTGKHSPSGLLPYPLWQVSHILKEEHFEHPYKLHFTQLLSTEK